MPNGDKKNEKNSTLYDLHSSEHSNLRPTVHRSSNPLNHISLTHLT